MTIQFFHHGNTIGEVTLDSATEDDARVFAATSMRLPITTVLDAAAYDGAETVLFNEADADRIVTAWTLTAA